jgi:hypothetical protein
LLKDRQGQQEMAVAEGCVNLLKFSLDSKIASLPSSTQVYMFKLERLTKIFCVCF